MSRNGSGVYSLPAGSTATTGEPIEASTHNTPLADIEADMNVARPIVAGGTGATTAAGARTNFGLGNLATQSDSDDIDFTGAVTFDGTTLVVDDANNRVGMGTASPSYPLHVTAAAVPAYIQNSDGSGTHALILATGGSRCRVNLSDGASTSEFHVAVGSAGDDLVFFANNSEKARIDATSGGFCVGRTSDSISDTGAGGILTAGGIFNSLRGGTGTNTHAQFINNAAVTPTTVGSITTSGSTTAYNTSSDQRLKENIADAGDAGSIIDALSVRSFDWIATGEAQRFGFVAQEVEVTFPEMVSTPDAETDPAQMKSVDYSKLVPLLVKEIQSLRARLAALEA